jgi:hypothetical protein
MKVFRVKSDVNQFQWFKPAVRESEILRFTTFDCTKIARVWQPPEVAELNPNGMRGDFAYYDPGCLLVGPSATQLVRPFFEKAGELLTLWFHGDEYLVLNIVECIDALDSSKTEWLRASDGSKTEIRRYAFDPGRFTQSSLFKIPETCRGSVLTWELDHSPENEFKAFVEKNGLSGLLFDELWDSEKQA